MPSPSKRLVSDNIPDSSLKVNRFVRRSSLVDSDGPAQSLSDTKASTRQPNKLLRELCAEALGTGLIVFLGTASVLSAVVAGELVGLGQIAATWAVAVTLAIATTAPVSCAHLNPAMTLSFSLLRRFPRSRVIPYVLAQMVGAMLASGINYVLYASKIAAFEAAKGIVRSSTDTAIQTAKCFGEYFLSPVTIMEAFLTEAFGTAVLAFCVFGLTHPRNDTTINKVYIPPLIGATVGALICALAPLTQAGVSQRDFLRMDSCWHSHFVLAHCAVQVQPCARFCATLGSLCSWLERRRFPPCVALCTGSNLWCTPRRLGGRETTGRSRLGEVLESVDCDILATPAR